MSNFPALTTFDENNFEYEEDVVIDGFMIEKQKEEEEEIIEFVEDVQEPEEITTTTTSQPIQSKNLT